MTDTEMEQALKHDAARKAAEARAKMPALPADCACGVRVVEDAGWDGRCPKCRRQSALAEAYENALPAPLKDKSALHATQVNHLRDLAVKAAETAHKLLVAAELQLKKIPTASELSAVSNCITMAARLLHVVEDSNREADKLLVLMATNKR